MYTIIEGPNSWPIIIISVISGAATKTSDSILLELSDPELHDEIRKMSDYVDKLLEQISFSLKSSNPGAKRKTLNYPSHSNGNMNTENYP